MSRVGRRVLPGLVLMSFALRWLALGADSLWYDETVSASLAAQPLPELVAHTARDIHPPGYYLLLHGWTRLAGESDTALAYPSLFFGVLLVALAYRLARRAWNSRVGYVAAFLVSVSPYHVWYSQEVRMYTLGAVLAAGVVLAILDIWQGRQRGWAWYVACSALGLWVLYYFGFLLLALNLVLWITWAMRWWGSKASAPQTAVAESGRPADFPLSDPLPFFGRWLLAQAAVAVLYAPWLSTAWRQAANPPVPPWRSFTPLWDVAVQTWTALSFGQSVDPQVVWPALLLTGVLVGWGALGAKRGVAGRRPVAAWAVPLTLATAFAGPVLLIYLSSYVTPLFHVRYAFTYSLPFDVLLAAGVWQVWRRWKLLGWLALVVVCGVSSWSLVRYHLEPQYASDDHRTAVATLAEQWRPGDAVVVNAGYAYTALEHYWPLVHSARSSSAQSLPLQRVRLQPGAVPAPGGVPVYLAGSVGGNPELGWGDPRSDFFSISIPDVEQALDELFARYHRVWVYRIYDTVTDPRGQIRAWLVGPEGRAPFFDQVFRGEASLRLQGYQGCRDPLADAERTWDQSWDELSLRLIGSEGPETASGHNAAPGVAVGGDLFLATVWAANPGPDAEFVLFTGLFDAEGRRWAQMDLRVPPARWESGCAPSADGVRIPMRLVVPPGTPPGRYSLEVGWYRFVGGEPEWLTLGGGADRLQLGVVEVVAPAAWNRLPLPPVAHRAGVRVGAVRLIGWEMPLLNAMPGQQLPVNLVWQSAVDAPQAARVALRLVDDSGRVVSETTLAPGEGGWVFDHLDAGQAVRQSAAFGVGGDVAPGVYTVDLRLLSLAGDPLPVRRGPFALGRAYPLATVRVTGREATWQPPRPQHPIDVRFGEYARLLGYDLQVRGQDPAATGHVLLALRLYWQVLQPTDAPYKIFVHLTDPLDPAETRAQADLYPRVPSTGWLPGEYLSDEVGLSAPEGQQAIRVGLYRDDASGVRLLAFDARAVPLGDHVVLDIVELRP